jgi:hypothetical protein
MKVTLNPMFDQASGRLGAIVFRRSHGQTVAGRRPIITAQPTEAQIEHRERFKQAAAFGKSVMADSSLRALYQALAESKEIPVFAAAVADFLSLPVIASIDLSAYHGSTGNPIRIAATDDFGVATVRVDVLDEDGVLRETGQAVESSAGSGQWTYTGQAPYAVGTQLTIHVVAADRPGGSAEATQSKIV